MASGSPATDEQLVERARNGEPRAFEELCKRYEGKLRARARHWIVGAVQRRVSLLDVLQEAYLLAHERLDDFEHRGDGAFGAWLAQIAEYEARGAVRRHAGVAKRHVGSEVKRSARPATAQARGPGSTPSQVAVAREETSAVRTALHRLSGDHRMVLELVRFDHLSLRDASVLMGGTYEATRKLYGRAVAALAHELEQASMECCYGQGRRPDEDPRGAVRAV